MSEKLVIEGGKPTIQEKLPSWPWFTEEIIQAAMEPLKTGKVNYWTGPLGMEFEKHFAKCNPLLALRNWKGSIPGICQDAADTERF